MGRLIPVPVSLISRAAAARAAALEPADPPPLPAADAPTADVAIITTGDATVPRRVQPAWRRPWLRMPRRVLAVVLATPALAGAAAMVALWWRDTPPATVRTPSDALVAAGRVSGLLGAYLLLLQVALMARIPWLERRIGSDWLGRAHRWLGGWLVGLLVAHAGLLIAGLGLVDHLPLADESVNLLLDYPDVLMAAVGLALLLAVGVLSARAVRRRLAYETWHATHLYAYLAVALAFAHQLAVGADFRLGAARAAWSAAHVLVLACVVQFRVLRPVATSRRHRLRVHAVARETDKVVSIYVTGRDLDKLGAEAGQYFRWRFLTRGAWWQAHPFSLSAPPSPRMLRLTVKALGDHTSALQRLRPGVRVIAEGPYGALTHAQRTRRRVLLIAGGIGITPMRALLESLPGGRGDISFVFRGDLDGAMVFQRELAGLAAARGVLVHYVIGPRATCCARHDALSTRRLRELVPDAADRDVYVCGPPGMMAITSEMLRRAGVPRRRIHAERFDL
jgi:predicted ferric reductase